MALFLNEGGYHRTDDYRRRLWRCVGFSAKSGREEGKEVAGREADPQRSLVCLKFTRREAQGPSQRKRPKRGRKPRGPGTWGSLCQANCAGRGLGESIRGLGSVDQPAASFRTRLADDRLACMDSRVCGCVKALGLRDRRATSGHAPSPRRTPPMYKVLREPLACAPGTCWPVWSLEIRAGLTWLSDSLAA